MNFKVKFSTFWLAVIEDVFNVSNGIVLCRV